MCVRNSGFHGVWLEQGSYSKKRLFCLLGCAFSNSFTERVGFFVIVSLCVVLLYYYFLPVLTGISGLQASLLSYPGYIRYKKKTQGTQCHVVLQDSGLLARAHLPSIIQSSMFVFYILRSGIQLCLVEEIGRDVSFHFVWSWMS